LFRAFFCWFLKIGLNEIRETFYRLAARYLKWNSLFLYYLLKTKSPQRDEKI